MGEASNPGFIHWLSAILTVVGGVAFFSSVFFRTAEAPPFASLNPRHWKPMWKGEVRTWFRTPGYALMVGGWVAFGIGLALRWVFVDWPW